MPANELTLKSIKELTEYTFIIPNYQRGYRWTKEQVDALIDDISEFYNNDIKIDDFYCLQPIVLKPSLLNQKTLECSSFDGELESGTIRLMLKNEVTEYHYSPTEKMFVASNQFEVLDGQQRLTTIFLILNYLEEKNFSLKHETRKETTDALNSPESASEEHIDLWHIKQAWNAIIKKRDTIVSENKEEKTSWSKTFLNQTKVIWYEPNGLSEEKDSIEIFSRINRGKIPLTNSELIRALFILKTKGNPPSELNEYKIASEWDFIEQQLHNNEFWCFCKLGNPFGKKEYPNRIEFFFDLIEERNPEENTHQTYSTFNMYAKKLKVGETVEQLWQEVKNLYYRLHEWFIDDDLYHLTGFFRLNNWMSLNDKKEEKGLLSNATNNKQSVLVRILKEKIKLKINMKDICLLKYKNQQIKSTLLLHNIAIYHQRNERFKFDRYKDTSWDIEHIRSQTPESDQRKWCKEIYDYWGLSEEIMPEDGLKKRLWLTLKTKQKNIDQNLIEELRSHFEENDDNEECKHDIGNLCLLDAKTNRGYGNAPFPVKRKRIINKISNGEFILQATQDVFMKFYSSQIEDMMYWKKKDSKSYADEICENINKFLGGNKNDK